MNKPVVVMIADDRQRTQGGDWPAFVARSQSNGKVAMEMRKRLHAGHVRAVIVPTGAPDCVVKILRDETGVLVPDLTSQQVLARLPSLLLRVGLDEKGERLPTRQRSGFVEEALSPPVLRLVAAESTPIPNEAPMPREVKWTANETAAMEAAFGDCGMNPARFVALYNDLTDGKERTAAELQLHLAAVAKARPLSVPAAFMGALDDLIDGRAPATPSPSLRPVASPDAVDAPRFVEDPDWVTGAVAAEETGITVDRLRNLANLGQIPRRKAPDGSNRYPLVALKLRLAKIAEKATKKAATPKRPPGRPPSRPSAPPPPVEQSQARSRPSSNEAVLRWLDDAVRLGQMTIAEALAKASALRG